MTAKGYRQKPSYQAVVDMASKAVRSLLPGSVGKNFRACGIAAEEEKVPENELNERLKQLLVAPENAGMVLDTGNASAENFTEVESHESYDKLDYILNSASDITEGLDADQYESSD